MIESWVLIREQSVDEEALRSLSLANAKHLVLGSVSGSGVILHVAANSAADLGNALGKFSEVPGVNEVLTLAIQNR